MKEEEKRLMDFGDMYCDERDYENAYRYYLEAATSFQNPEAMENLGLFYLFGDYPEKNYEKGFHYLKKRCEIDHRIVNISALFGVRDRLVEDEKGKALLRDYLEYLEENGVTDVWLIIADEYGHGELYPRNINKKIEYLTKAGENGLAIGYESLGEMFYLGEEVDPDYKKAMEYFDKVNGNCSFAKPFYLAEMYRKGLGVEKNISKAYDNYLSITESKIPMCTADYYYIQAVKILREMEEED